MHCETHKCLITCVLHQHDMTPNTFSIHIYIWWRFRASECVNTAVVFSTMLWLIRKQVIRTHTCCSCATLHCFEVTKTRWGVKAHTHTHTETYTYQQMRYILSSHKHCPLRMWQSYLTVKLDSEPPLETCREETWNTCSIISRLIENSVGGPAPCESTQQGFVRHLDTTQINSNITYVNQCTQSHRSSTPRETFTSQNCIFFFVYI